MTADGRRTKPSNARISRITSAGKAARKKAHRAKPSREKVRAFRKRMRAKGLRLVQMWLPDTRTAKFAAEAKRQSRLANGSRFAAADQAWVDSLSNWNTG
jgi:hypothetical protein